MVERLTLEDLKRMNTVQISNATAAKVLKIDAGRLADYARKGELQWATQDIDGRVYHSREDFIRYWTGEQKRPEQTTEDLLKDVLFHLDLLAKAVISLQDARQREMFLRLIEEHKKTASAATPAE